MRTELERAIIEQYEAERRLEECRRRVKELLGIVPESEQRKSAKKTLNPKDFAKACGL